MLLIYTLLIIWEFNFVLCISFNQFPMLFIAFECFKFSICVESLGFSNYIFVHGFAEWTFNVLQNTFFLIQLFLALLESFLKVFMLGFELIMPNRKSRKFLLKVFFLNLFSPNQVLLFFYFVVELVHCSFNSFDLCFRVLVILLEILDLFLAFSLSSLFDIFCLLLNFLLCFGFNLVFELCGYFSDSLLKFWGFSNCLFLDSTNLAVS
ncbi:unnamed protein product [Moneuplotes crassus]|uniref:Uncharacterized protein n=1 Tax=Euplotes crassus TaxID=5936 RepID=A0AAD1U9L0_EUPCR|nr:unnamed protein product [Moneuplotes crassus]